MSATTVVAEHILTRTKEQLKVANPQFGAAIKEIERVQREIGAPDKEPRTVHAIQGVNEQGSFYLEMKMQDTRRQGWEEGRKQGLEEGIRGGEMEGSHRDRRDGTNGIRVTWELGNKRLQPETAPSEQSGQGSAKVRLC